VECLGNPGFESDRAIRGVDCLLFLRGDFYPDAECFEPCFDFVETCFGLFDLGE